MGLSAKERVMLEEMSQKNVSFLILTSLFLTPVSGSLYLNRIKALAINFIVLFLLLILPIVPYLIEFFDTVLQFHWLAQLIWVIFANLSAWFFNNHLFLPFYIVYLSISIIESSSAVINARKKLSILEYPEKNDLLNENIEIILIKFARKKEGVTLADCIIETGMSSREIKQILQQMLEDEVIELGNRKEDGAIIYRAL
ncbi:MAG: hypothetical protein ACRCU2_11555 [Planktothrix sp.]